MNDNDPPMYLPLSWEDDGGTTMAITKDEEPAMTKKLVLVEAVTMYRMRYVVECDDVHHAADEVAMDLMRDEFSQLHLGETITSSREISREEYLRLFNEDNDYLRAWTDEEKFRLVHKIDYDKQ